MLNKGYIYMLSSGKILIIVLNHKNIFTGIILEDTLPRDKREFKLEPLIS